MQAIATQLPQVPQAGCHTGFVGYGSRSPVQQLERVVGHHGVAIVQKRLRESGEAMTNVSDLTVILVNPSACLITVLG